MTLSSSLGPDLLSYALLVIALHTGRNTTPLLELTTSCLIPHSREGLMFLQLNKRQGHTPKTKWLSDRKRLKTKHLGQKYGLPLSRLIRNIIRLIEPPSDESPPYLKSSLWLYRVPAGSTSRQLTTLTSSVLLHHADKLIKHANLTDDNGNCLRLNFSRLRKTFINKVYEILDEDLIATAAAASNSQQVTAHNYLRPPEKAGLR